MFAIPPLSNKDLFRLIGLETKRAANNGFILAKEAVQTQVADGLISANSLRESQSLRGAQSQHNPAESQQADLILFFILLMVALSVGMATLLPNCSEKKHDE